MWFYLTKVTECSTLSLLKNVPGGLRKANDELQNSCFHRVLITKSKVHKKHSFNEKIGIRPKVECATAFKLL